MNFFSLTSNFTSYIIALITISFIFLIISIIVSIAQKKRYSLWIVLSSFLFLTTLDLLGLMELNYYTKEIYEFNLSIIGETIGLLPNSFHIFLGVGGIVLGVYTMYKTYKSSKNEINPFSIKEALENLPTGIAFISKNNELYLSNHIIHKIYKDITKKDLRSGVDIWGDISSFMDSSRCVIKGSRPAFVLSGAKVWQFSKSHYTHGDMEYDEIKAVEITRLFNLSKNMQEVNEELVKQQERLEVLSSIIEENTQREVVLDMKVNFHDEFGNLLALTKETLRKSPELNESKIMARYWARLSDIITDLASNKKEELSYEKILHLSEKLGCEIILKGEVPKDEEVRDIILLAINESLKNAYSHGKAPALKVEIIEDKDKICVIIYNEIKKPPFEIIEGGGLSGLRQRIEKVGGSMDIRVEGGVVMNITLNKVCEKREEYV